MEGAMLTPAATTTDMDRNLLIFQQNIERFQRLLLGERDETRRRQIATLMAEARQGLAEIESMSGE
jgi:hypothetical protein